ncbi:MAG TPA: glycosyltransferase family 4 protein [Solirubrobacteraceae bacterium]|nr:glycosyltransferase family 4 protein [Solirubrobacteraceae bacterium]
MKLVSVMTTDSSGGAEFAAIEMLDALRERGHDVVMLSDMAGMERDTGVPVVRIDIGPKLSLRSWVKLTATWPLLAWRLRRALAAQEPYDALLLHYKKEQLLALALPAPVRRRVVWAEWGKVPYQLHTGAPGYLYRAAAKQARLVMCVSQGTLESVRSLGVDPAKLVVVPNVLRTEEIRFSEEGRARVRDELGIPPEAFVVGCISRFHPKKRNDVVIDAVRRLDDDRVHLILAGDGEAEQQLRQLAEPLGERVHFIPTPGREVPDVLSAFDVSVFCPSPTEGAPRAVILGMLASRPCLSTGPEGVADMIAPELGGIASPENQPEAVQALLERYLDHPDRVQREGAAARAHAERTYAAPVVAAEIERLLQEALRA